MLHEIADILIQSLKITVFVLVMMIIPEYIAIRNKNKQAFSLKNAPGGQIILAALLGVVPGCMGTFAVVSMYIHRSMGFAALVTALIATSGDEAFFMLSAIPSQGLIVMTTIMIIAIIVGFILNATLKTPFPIKSKSEFFEYTQKEQCPKNIKENSLHSLNNYITWQRLVLLAASLIFIIATIFINTEHSHALPHDAGSHAEWGWERISLLIAVIVGLIIVATTSSHFVNEHIWNHVMKKHFLKILVWTIMAFAALHFLNEQIDIKDWIIDNVYYLMLLALLLGIIPESGPHLIFVVLFMSGTIPLSVLIAGSIVQDGHGAIPLLAESRKSFILAKIINFVAGAIVGYGLLFFGT